MGSPKLSLPAAPAAPAARRLAGPRWLRGRVLLGVLLVAAAVVGGAALLRSADATSTVLATSRDLPSGVPLADGDLEPIRVRLPDAQLAAYTQPDGEDPAGARLVTGLPAGALVPRRLAAPRRRAHRPDRLPGARGANRRPRAAPRRPRHRPGLLPAGRHRPG